MWRPSQAKSQGVGVGLGAQSFLSFGSLQTAHAGTTVQSPPPVTIRGSVREAKNLALLPVTAAVTMAVGGWGEGVVSPQPPPRPVGSELEEGGLSPAWTCLGRRLF